MIFDVKFTFGSVIRPSSNTCKNTVSTSGWAFSISSSKTMAFGFFLSWLVRFPPSSYP